jgi:hypothetical protein
MWRAAVRKPAFSRAVVVQRGRLPPRGNQLMGGSRVERIVRAAFERVGFQSKSR